MRKLRPGTHNPAGGVRTPGARLVWPPKERQSASAAIEALMRERGLARRFDRQVERAASRARDRGLDARADAVTRRDLTDLATFTIDPAGARDFDDAISAQSLPDGVRVWVHIADVSAYVKEGSPVDLEARRRGSSVYVPGAVEPMLPEALSNDACSLLAGNERLTVTVELELQGADVARAAFYRSVIRSDERLDYGRVDRIFAGRESAGEPWRAPLGAARDAAAALQRKRERSGALVVDSAEPEFVFDEEGNISEIRGRAQTESHRLVEHLMIAANEAVAGLLQRRRVPCLYRVHERPEPDRIERLIAQLASLDVPTPPLPESMSAAQAAELVGAISRGVNDHVSRTRRGRIALNSLLLRSLKQAYYSPKNLGHAGLHASSYCHFTSPIRRYPDLVCHRALLSAVAGGETAPPRGELVELGAWTSEREREAMTIEHDADDVACCFALERVLYDGGWEQAFAGEVVGLISAGAFVAFGGGVGTSGATGAGPPGARARASGAQASGVEASRAQASGAEAPRAEASGSEASGAEGSGAEGSGAEMGEAGNVIGVYEGMLPVRRVRLPSADRRAAGEWWEINELGTILRGERTGVSLRLGDPIEVRVARVDTLRGRVDLIPADEETPGG